MQSSAKVFTCRTHNVSASVNSSQAVTEGSPCKDGLESLDVQYSRSK